ncbi:MAG: NAD(P)/FAD-dependent oxidoreductase [Ramlibacter sp.]|nr:NAD(P)/FAD-dependent oxidoreductase [Ramlibacter sp.]
MEFLDVVVVGAGLSGIAAGHYLQALCASRSYAILESRDAIGGTWDLFRYPGVRSDSDMSTLGYSFRPWTSDTSFAPAEAIRDYVQQTARDEGIDTHIRFGRRVTGANWDSKRARWIVATTGSDGDSLIECSFLFFCSGYYDYERGYEPQWPGREHYSGTIVHPQQWPKDLDYSGKRVVVIGSGATAITLVPEMAKRAAHVTMLQRSPSYIMGLPARDKLGALLRKCLPQRAAHRIVRWKNIVLATLLFQFSRRRPEAMKRLIRKGALRLLGPSFDVDRHLSPRYNPWDQRLCIAPDADFFRSIRAGKAAIVTDEIECFTAQGLRLASGEELLADVIVSATGLRLKMMGGAALTIDGAQVDGSQSVVYRGTMYSGVPNLAVASGYTNASWTLKCELSARYVCRLLNEMQAKGLDTCVAVRDESVAASEPVIDLSSGYIQRAAATLPRQGDRTPWRMYQNYFLDLLTLRFSRLRDGVLKLSRVGRD